MADKDPIKRRVKALREMTKANGCTEAEAEAAMAAAARLMKEHGLAAEDLDMEREDVPTTSRSTVLDQLWATIAARTGCVQVKVYTTGGWRWQYIGRQPGPAIATYLHTYLARHIELAVRQYQETRDYKRKKKGLPRRRACEAFRDGMVQVLRRTVRQHFDRPEPAAIEAAERYRDSLYSNLEKFEPREIKTRHENARLAGAVAGAGVEIRTGLGGGTAGLIGRE